MPRDVPLVTAVVPAVRVDDLLGVAVASLLQDGCARLEVVVVLDGAPEDVQLPPALYDDRVRVIHLPQRVGTPAALNVGWRAGSGTYIARLDADDISLPGRVDLQRQHLDAHAEVDVVGSAAHVIDASGSRRGSLPARQGDLRRALVRSNQLVHSSVMMRRSALDRVGGYNEACQRKQDYELWLRLARGGGVVALAQHLVQYRVHGGQSSRRPPARAAVRAVFRARRRLARDLGLPASLMVATGYQARWVLAQATLYSGLRRPGYLSVPG